jgi:hypothetical protein
MGVLELRAVHLRAEAINRRLGVERVICDGRVAGECVVIHYGVGRRREFRSWAEAEAWLDGFAAMIDAQGTPCPEPLGVRAVYSKCETCGLRPCECEKWDGE